MKKPRQNWSRRKPRPEGEKKGFLKKLYDAFESRTISAIVLLVTSVLLFVFVYLVGYTNFGDWFRQKQEQVTEFTAVKYYPIEGIVVDCDSIPIVGLTMVIRGHDVPSTTTDENGFFTASVQLPVTLTEVSIRFIDSLNQEIYSTLYALDKNAIAGDKTLIYSIPDRNLNKK